MSEVIEFKKLQAESTVTTSGAAKCFQCQHEFEYSCSNPSSGNESDDNWEFLWFECPECKCMKATFIYTGLPEDKTMWCCGCGNHLFYIVKDGFYCPICLKENPGM
jgi:hypothetical protein